MLGLGIDSDRNDKIGFVETIRCGDGQKEEGNDMGKRLASVLLILVLCFTMMPTTAWSAEGETAQSGGAVAEVTIGDSTTQYTDIEAAFTAAQEAASATVKLLQDVTIPKTENGDSYGICLEKGSIVLDLNGKTIQTTEYSDPDSGLALLDAVFYLENAMLTVRDNAGNGKIQQPNAVQAISVSSGGTLTVESGTIEVTSDEEASTSSYVITQNCAVFVSRDGKANIQGGKLIGRQGIYIRDKDGTLTITGEPQIQGKASYALQVAGGKVTLSGGTYSREGNECSILNAAGTADKLLDPAYRYEGEAGQKATYNTDGTGVVGTAVVKKRPVGEVSYINASGKETTQAGCVSLTTDGFENQQAEGVAWYAADSNITSEVGFTVTGTVNLILCDGVTVKLNNSLFINDSSTLNIFSQHGGTGRLEVVAAGSDAGIGNNSGTAGTVSNLNIYGGTVTAQAGGSGAAAIGKGTGAGATVNVTIAEGMKCVRTDNQSESCKWDNTAGTSVTITKCEDHKWAYTYEENAGQHTKKCSLCGVQGETEPHSFGTWTSDGETNHTGTCVCGETKTEAHKLELTPNADGVTHSKKCSICDYTAASEAHDFTGRKDYSTGESYIVCKECSARLAASYDNVKYASLQRAIDAAKNSGGTVTLEQEVEEHVAVADGEVTIDLNDQAWGKNLSDKTNDYVPLTVTGGRVTLKNGRLHQEGASSEARMGVLINGGSLIVAGDVSVRGGNDGNLKHSIDLQSGSLTLSEGTALLTGLKVPADKKLADYLPAGTAFVKCTYTEAGVVNIPAADSYEYITEAYTGNATTESMAVVAHTHDIQKSADGTYQCVCGFTCTAKVSRGGEDEYYVALADALTHATEGATVTLLAAATDAGGYEITHAIALDLNGFDIGKLTCSAEGVKIWDRGENKGTIGTLTVSGGRLKDLLPEGYGFQKGNAAAWASESELKETTISDVSVKQTPIKSLSLTVTKETVTYGYKEADAPVIRAAVAFPSESTSTTGVTYRWYQIGESGAEPITGVNADTYQLNTGLDAGTYTFYCIAAVDGYEAAGGNVRVTVEKAEADGTAPQAAESLFYTGSAQKLITPGSTSDGVMAYSLAQNGTYTGDIPAGTDAGTYTVWYKITGDKNHKDSGPVSMEVTIAPMKLSGVVRPEADGVNREYDKTDAAELTAVTFLKENGTDTINLAAGDYTVSNAHFNDGNAGNDKQLIFTVTLKSRNYVFAGEAAEGVTEKTFRCAKDSSNAAYEIAKAAAPTNLVNVDIIQKYTITEGSASAAGAGMPQDAGTLSYAKKSDAAIGKVAHWEVDAVTGKVTYTLSGGAANDTITLPVTISSTNYKDAAVSIVITLTEKNVPTVTVQDLTVTYDGSPVSAGKIQGTAVFEGKPVAGTWEWKSSTAITVVADSGKKTVVFKPQEPETYAEVAKNIYLTINKATPTGTPKYTAITESGKKLSDAGLTTEGSTLSTGGAVKWVDKNENELSEETEVVRGEAYSWEFTPTDTGNYNKLTGTIILWAKPSSTGGGTDSGTGGGGGAAGTTDPKDDTKQDDTGKDDSKQDDPKQDDTKQDEAAPAPVGTKVKDSSGTAYQVTSDGGKKPTVAYKAAAKKAKGTVTIPKTVTIDGTKYKVTSIAAKAFAGNKNVKRIVLSQNITEIGARAFANCPKLKTITIHSTKLTSKNVADGAFAGIEEGTVIRVPQKMLARYQKLFVKKGLSEKVKVVAIKDGKNKR